MASGVEQIIFITSEGKSAIGDLFDYNYHLDYVLKEKNKTELAPEVSNSSNRIDIVTVYQKKPLGLGHAIWTASHVVGNEPFMVLLVDYLLFAQEPCAKQMLKIFADVGESIVAVQLVPNDQAHQYGIVESAKNGRTRTFRVTRIVKKPAP